MKRYLPLLCLVSLWCLANSCRNLGKEKTFNGVELYHTQSITDTEADRLGNYLVSAKFADGKEKTVQIAKSGDTYQFRFVIKEGADKNTALPKTFRLFATALSADVFNNAPVDVVTCDEYLKPIQTFHYVNLGTKKIFKGVELYYTANVKAEQADSLGNYLIKSEFANGEDKLAQLTKSGNVYQFRFVANPGAEKDQHIMTSTGTYATEISAAVFGGAPVEIQFCDETMTPHTTVQMSPAQQH